MDFTAIISDLTDMISEVAHAYPFVALVVVLVLAYLIYRKPMFFISVFILGAILLGVLYLIISISSPGIAQKEKMIRREKEPENSFRLPGFLS
jgi:hypothetical protein